MESPALPVSHGAAVTLRCRPKLNSSDHIFHFYREGHLISRSSTGIMTIPYASKSDEGLYKCSIAGGEESESSWLTVEGNSLEIITPIFFFQIVAWAFVFSKQSKYQTQEAPIFTFVSFLHLVQTFCFHFWSHFFNMSCQSHAESSFTIYKHMNSPQNWSYKSEHF